MSEAGKIPLDNLLIPKHEVLPKDKEDEALAIFSATKANLPKIRANDPQVKKLEAKPGDIIKITRRDRTGENLYYRVVK
ncbi:MAG: DNA-directed RNA polymerase subunit H [Candidatus Micrarchaeota archaeon]